MVARPFEFANPLVWSDYAPWQRLNFFPDPQ